MEVFRVSFQLLKEYLTEKYGDFSAKRLTGGYTNETYLLKGSFSPVVAKIAISLNEDFQNEINSLKLVQDSGKAPKLYDYFEVDNVQISVMEYRSGTNGQSILDLNDLVKTKELYKSLGEILSEHIHSRKYNGISNGIKECTLHELNMNVDFIPESLVKQSQELLEQIKDRKDDWVLTHDDFGIHNVLYDDNNQLTVLDWEWAEWANPLTDIGWVCWFTKLHYAEHANNLNSIFLNEYQKQSDFTISNEKLKSYCLYKVWKILNKVKNAPDEVKYEWINRLKWTLEVELL